MILLTGASYKTLHQNPHVKRLAMYLDELPFSWVNSWRSNLSSQGTFLVSSICAERCDRLRSFNCFCKFRRSWQPQDDYQRSVNQMKSYDICELLYLPYLRTFKTKINSKQSAVYSGQISRVVTQLQILRWKSGKCTVQVWKSIAKETPGCMMLVDKAEPSRPCSLRTGPRSRWALAFPSATACPSASFAHSPSPDHKEVANLCNEIRSNQVKMTCL